MAIVAGFCLLHQTTDYNYCMVYPITKAFRKSRPRCLMSLALPVTTKYDNIVVLVQ